MARSGLAFWRAITLPSTATTNSLRTCSALRVGFRLCFFVEDDLDDAGAVADVEEEEIAEVAAAGYPAQDDGVFAGVGGAQGAAVVGAF